MEPEEERGGVNGGEAARKDGQLRIYIGGLGGGITADDLKKTFSTPQLGSVESVEIIRSKGRSIAYLDFRPCSEKGLAKLFSTYNGCLWKGGKLRLEKAKEHYMIRMKREWEEAAQLSSASDELVDSVESVSPPVKLVKDRFSNSEPINIFFPKLRKVKPLPFKGSGKHKYSFQRVAVPPLPVHFCDCDEHSVPSDIATESYKHENEVYEIKDEEFDMMNSVMSKLFDRKKVPQPASIKAKVAVVAPISTHSNDEFQLDDNTDDMSDDEDLVINVVGRSDDDPFTNKQRVQHSQSRPLQRKQEIQGKKAFQKPAYGVVEHATKAPSPAASTDVSEVEMSDDDDLVFNVVSGSNKKIPSIDTWVQKTVAGDKKLQASQPELENGKRKLQEKNTMQSEKKRKVTPDEDKKGKPYTKRDLQAADIDSGVQPSNTNNLHAKGVSWRDLVSGKDNDYFSISDVIPSEPPMVKKQSKSETQDVFDKGNQSSETSKAEVVKTTSEVLPQIPKAKTSRAVESTSPAQKFSWKNIVGGLDDGSFSLSQVVPESKNLGKQEQRVNTLPEPNPERSGLILSNSGQVSDIAKSGEVALSSELHIKKAMPVKETTRRANGAGEEAFKFQRSNASLKAALSRSRTAR